MKNITIFTVLSWLWLSLVIMASLVPKPKSYVCKMIKKLQQLASQSDIDKNVHLVFYFLLVFLFILGYANYKMRVLLFFAAILLSGIIEILQPLVTHGIRKCDIHDFVFNVLGCSLGLVLAITLEYLIGICKKKTLRNNSSITTK